MSNMVIAPVIDPEAMIDFYASNDRAYRSLLPLWEALKGRQGTFFASRHVHQNGTHLSRVDSNIQGFSPIVVSEYKDLHDIYTLVDNERPIIMYELGQENNLRGLGSLVSLFLCKDQRILGLRKAISNNALLFDNEQSAANYLLSFIKGKDPEQIEAIDNHSVGMIYVAFGDKAKHFATRSKLTLKRLGYAYPSITVSEDNWEHESPFDVMQRKNFQFRAGRVKPFLYDYSPFDFNLYIDADTKFIKPIHEGFEYLRDYDLVVTEESLSLKELYNKRLAGWEINLSERDITINELKVSELGPTEDRKFLNTGVFFFRKNKKTKKLFQDWRTEWLRFQEWDEQLAFMRAINHNTLKIKYLSTDWNSPRMRDNIYIYHSYGRGDVRINL